MGWGAFVGPGVEGVMPRRNRRRRLPEEVRSELLLRRGFVSGDAADVWLREHDPKKKPKGPKRRGQGRPKGAS